MLSSLYKNLPFFFLFQPFYGFNWNRGWRAGEWEIFFSCWPCGTSFIGSRLCRRIGHSAYLKCIVGRCAGGYVSVNVTELQCRRKIVFHTEIPMDPTPVSSLKIASGLFVEPRTINFFKNSFIALYLEFSLFFFLIRCPIHEPKNSLRHAKCWEQLPRFQLQKELNCRFHYYAITFSALPLFRFCFSISSFPITTIAALSSFFVLSPYCNALPDAINYTDFEDLCVPIKTDTDLG